MNDKISANFSKGIFTLSLDTELAWGMADKPNSLINNKKYFCNTRKSIEKIIKLLEKYKISATWAIVGALLLDKLSFEHRFIEGVTTNLDAATKKQYIDLLNKEEIWWGVDILDKIKSCAIPQEIASHSFTHIIFDDKTTTKEKALNEFINGFNILERQNIQPISFVFPRNRINYLKELKNAGFKSYRGVEPSWYRNLTGNLKKACHIFDQALSITPPVAIPSYRDGLLNIPASMFYLPMNGFRRYIPLKSRVKKAYKGIQRAINEKKVFHLWFHPFNIAAKQDEILKGLEAIFKKVYEERNKGNLEVMNMKEIVEKQEYLVNEE